ncbi:MAG: hypothetical protein ED557_08660 [Balneola sp.]|nr:MAG: hypothetical protein ED557_08660 [Balneola sp.]
MSNSKILLGGTLFTIVFAIVLFMPKNEATEISVEPEKLEVVMYKNEGCMCCTKWADKMNEQEFAVIEKPVPNLYEIKEENGITRELASCHTAFVDGYIVEGHVPIEDVQRLLKERPDAIGLTVPGMPIGSPGMEVPGREADNYDVLLIAKDGTTTIYASH